MFNWFITYVYERFMAVFGFKNLRLFRKYSKIKFRLKATVCLSPPEAYCIYTYTVNQLKYPVIEIGFRQ
ncbi:hypothetical protein ABIC84_002883 [Mucilaginibacter sp. 3215]